MNLLMNELDQKFTLYDMLKADQWFHDFSREDFNQTLKAAKALAEKEIYPTLQDADEQGCVLENGKIRVPKSFHRLKEIFDDGGWSSLGISKDNGGQGLTFSAWMAAGEWFAHNSSFLAYSNRTMGAAYLIQEAGSPAQKKRYLPKLVTGAWGGPVSVTEADAGSDITNIQTTAVRQADGSYRINGTKTMISNGDADMFSNMVYIVLARIEGAPAGFGGLSLFIVPKYRVNDDGTLGTKNDYTILNIEKKMGINGWGVCTTCFGDNAACYAELVGEENQGLALFMSVVAPSQISLGLWSCGVASAAYCHALAYAGDRKQGAHMADAFNPEAPRVPVLAHPDVRRMLMWMKAHVEGMRSLTYYCALLIDKIKSATNEQEIKTYTGLCAILTPVCRVYSTDTAFKVTEQAMQVFGGSGYFKDYPIEQFMRDIKPASLLEGTNGIQALQMLVMGMGADGENFMTLLGEMNLTLAPFQTDDRIKELVLEVQSRITALGEVGLFFSQCSKEGNFLVPVAHAYPFLNMLGIVCMGWMLVWQAGIAQKKLLAAMADKGIDRHSKQKTADFLKKNQTPAFYDGKCHTAKFYVSNCLPMADAFELAVKKADLSMVDIHDTAF